MDNENIDNLENEEAPVEEAPKDYEAEANEFKDKFLRAHAEMENLRKRFNRERSEIAKYSKESLLKDFMRVYDAIEKSITMAKEHHPDDESFVSGLQMTEKMLLDILKQNGVEPIETENAVFDPNYHEALMQVKRDDLESGMVAQELEKGFMLHDRVLRPAKVMVSE